MSEKSDPVRFVRVRGLPDKPGVLRKGAHQLALSLVNQKREEGLRQRLWTEIKICKDGLALPENAASASVGVLGVENRIVLALLDHLRQVEIERRVVLAHQHHEPDSIRADLFHDLTQGHELAGTLRHFDRFAGAHETHKLAKPHLEL